MNTPLPSLPCRFRDIKAFLLHRSCTTDGHLASAQSELEDCLPRRAQSRWPCRVCYVRSRNRGKREPPDIIIPVSDECMVLVVWVSPTQNVNACRPGHYDILDRRSSESPPIGT